MTRRFMCRGRGGGRICPTYANHVKRERSAPNPTSGVHIAAHRREDGDAVTLIGESAAVAPTDGTAGADATLSGSLGGLIRVGAAFSMPSAASMSSRIDEGVRELA